MMKRLFNMAACLLAGISLIACSGSDDVTSSVTPVEPSTGNNSVVLKGTLGNKGDMTRSLNGEGQSAWAVGETFAIYYPTTSSFSTAVATVESLNDNGSANFAATLYYPKTGNSNVKFIYPASAHDGHGGIKASVLKNQLGTIEYISQNADIHTATAALNVVEQSNGSAKATLNTDDVQMDPELCIFTFNLKKEVKQSGQYVKKDLPSTKLEISDGTNSYTVTPASATSSFTVAMLPVTGANFTFEATTTESGAKLEYVKDFVPTNIDASDVGNVIDVNNQVYHFIIDKAGYYKSSTGTLEKGVFYSQDLVLVAAKNYIKAVAMIAYVGDQTGETAYTHGLAVAVFDEKGTRTNSGPSYMWKDVSSFAEYDNEEGSQVTMPAEYIPSDPQKSACVPQAESTSLFPSESGLQYRAARNNATWPAFQAAANYDPVYNFSETTYNHRSDCSPWFLCSAYQMNLMINACKNVTGTTGTYKDFQKAFDIRGGIAIQDEDIWTVTECSNGRGGKGVYGDAWYLKFKGSGTASAACYWMTKAKDNNSCKVRPVFAF